jgi:hypothetical protein
MSGIDDIIRCMDERTIDLFVCTRFARTDLSLGLCTQFSFPIHVDFYLRTLGIRSNRNVASDTLSVMLASFTILNIPTHEFYLRCRISCVSIHTY